MPKVSVLVPVYNVERYLCQCLDSIVHQTLQDIEIICVDDGSTDQSGVLLDEYAAQYPCCKVIHKNNTGYGHSMNTGLKIASGEYIGIVESDDFVDVEMFERLYGHAVRQKADIVKSNYWQYQCSDHVFCEALASCPYEKVYFPRKQDSAIFYCTQSIWSAIYRREFLLEHEIYFNETPGASYQDVSFSFKVLACAERVFLVKDAFVHYRMDNPNSSVKSKEKVYCIFDEIANIETFLEKKNEMKEHCACILAPLKYKLCQESYLRVASCFKMDFLRRAIEEMKATAEAGYVRRENWDKFAWEQVQEMLQNSNRFLYRAYNRMQKMKMLHDGFWGRVDNSKKIYLYGAGKVAQRIIELFCKKKIELVGCLVSGMAGNTATVLGVPVIEYGDAGLNGEDVLILLALKEESQYDILQKLQLDGYMNVIPLDRELRESLEEASIFATYP